MHKLTQVLQQQYAITPTGIQPQAGGFSALAYKVTTPNDAYFLKVYDKSKTATAHWTALIDIYVPFLSYLNQNTHLRGKIPHPIQTAHNEWKCEDEEYIYQLFNYIDGYTVGEAGLTTAQARELAHIIGSLHQHNADTIPGSYEQMTEDFSLPFCSKLTSFISSELLSRDSEIEAIITRCQPQLEKAIDRVAQLSESLSQTHQAFVFCHTDIHGFNIMQSDRLALIDWEGLKLAPPEHDLMFIYGKPYYSDFMQVYMGYHPGFKLNHEALDFYLVRRDLEDIWAFIEGTSMR